MDTNITVRVTDRVTGETTTHRTHNTICEGYHKLLTRLADPEDALKSDDLTYHLDVGEDDSATPSYTDTQLNTKVARTQVTDFVNEGTNLFTSTLLDTGEANPTGGDSFQSIVEVGVVAETDDGTEYLCNHSTITEIQKTESKKATIDATLELNNDLGDA